MWCPCITSGCQLLESKVQNLKLLIVTAESTNAHIWPLFTDGPVEFEKWPVQVSELSGNRRLFNGNYNWLYLKPEKRTEWYPHVIGWTWKHLDLDQLCPKSPWIVVEIYAKSNLDLKGWGYGGKGCNIGSKYLQAREFSMYIYFWNGSKCSVSGRWRRIKSLKFFPNFWELVWPVEIDSIFGGPFWSE